MLLSGVREMGNQEMEKTKKQGDLEQDASKRDNL
jgi:hypothetical protein